MFDELVRVHDFREPHRHEFAQRVQALLQSFLVFADLPDVRFRTIALLHGFVQYSTAYLEFPQLFHIRGADVQSHAPEPVLLA